MVCLDDVAGVVGVVVVICLVVDAVEKVTHKIAEAITSDTVTHSNTQFA